MSTRASIRCSASPGWPLERVLFALAGTVTLVSALLAALVSPWFLALTAFVGVNQRLYVAFGACPASLVLSRAFALCSVVYPKKVVR
jgi:predicted signal transduction protein with EAL and GGDEF domain